ncbi:MAG: aspartate aminotransferase family protein [Thermomicrobiales bacterium]
MISRAQIDPEQVTADALAHLVFGNIHQADLRDRGPNIYVKGEGITLTDIRGNTYLDMMSTHTRANSLGYANEEIAKAINDQLLTVHYVGTTANLAPPTIQLATKIAALAPGRLEKVYFVNDGSEAVEAALKIAKQFHQNSGTKPRAYKVISRWNAYHGATMGAIGATDWLGTKNSSEPGVPGYSFVPGPMNYRNPLDMEPEAYADLCATFLERQILREGPELVAAFIGEPIMQANGVQIPPASYWPRVREICDKYGVLLIIDEVICGFGRTGAWFASEHFDIEPDILTMAKALTAGYIPMGGVIAKAEIVDAIPTFRHIHTFSGHAIAATAANIVIAIKERDNLIQQARDNGAFFLDGLTQALGSHPIVGDVRGKGMWLAIDFTRDKQTKAPFEDDTLPAIVRRAYKQGVIVSAIGTAIEIAPPLIATRAELDRAVDVLRQAVCDIAAERGLD